MKLWKGKHRQTAAIVRQCEDERGFTLIETLVALGVLMISLVGIASLAAYAIAYNSGAGARELALTVAQQQMEQLRSVPFNDASLIASSETTSTVTSGGQNFKVAKTIVDTPSGAPTLKTITLKVTPQNQTSGWAGSSITVTDQRAANTMGAN